MFKKLGMKSLTAIIVFSLFTSLIINASAATVIPNASNYLSSYSASVTNASGGRIIVNFDVNATRVMQQVGASYIVVQVYNSGTWTGVASYFGSTTSGMLAYNTFSNVGSVGYQGIAGQLYRALVTVYAADSTGSDSRQVTTNSVYGY